MEETKDLIPVAEEMNGALPEVIAGDMYTTPAVFEHIQRVAKVFANSKLVPEAYRNNVADCIIAMEMAHRLGVSPMMVMQHTCMIHGRPGVEGKFVIGLVNKRGPYPAGIKFKYEGDGLKRKCIASGVRANGEVDEVEFSLQQAKDWGWYDKAGSPWPKMPDQMLAYRAGVFLARRYCPEVLMGVPPAREELEDVEQ